MFKFNSFTSELPTNSPPEINNVNTNTTNDTTTPIVHINNLTINITPNQAVECLQELVKSNTYKQVPKYIRNNEWCDDCYDNNNYHACIMPNKKLRLNIKKSNKPSPLDLYNKK
tara:strand:+ start:1701 stop:2042 length:342 start_codon:yes stop_codon:yes gene_type:complete